MTKLAAQSLSIILRLHDRGPAASSEMQAAMPSVPNMAALISRLKDGGYLHYDSGPLNRPLYAVAPKGLRAIGATAKPVKQVELGQMPAPRTAPPSGLYKPAPWTPPREASTQHEKCPSVWNGEVTPYTRPRSNSGRAMVAVGMHGGVM